MKIDRRHFCKLCLGSVASCTLGNSHNSVAATNDSPIRALMPRDESGHYFLFYSDCTSGRPGAPQVENLQRLNSMIKRIEPQPEFVVFPGDAIMGYTQDYAELSEQWNYWYGTEMKWLQTRGLQMYQSTSNHNTYDAGSEQVFREVHAELPQNGPEGQKGLAYYVRRGNFLYISTHQAHMRQVIDHVWLDRVLQDNADAKYKFVGGHYPVFPINGYVANPQWCFPPHLRKPFWDVMLKHGVDAYLGSHIIAFDVQVHEGLLQVTSASAGSVFGPDGFMRGSNEYFHAVQMAVDQQGLRFQTHDAAGNVRERLAWPFILSELKDWLDVNDKNANQILADIHWRDEIASFRVKGLINNSIRGGVDQTIVSTSHNVIGLPGGEIEPLWVGIDADSNHLVVRIVPLSGESWQQWKGPVIRVGEAFDYQIVLHAGMGPGGVMLRDTGKTHWSTMASFSNRGIEGFRPPSSWTIGHGQSGIGDRPFAGENLSIQFTKHAIPF